MKPRIIIWVYLGLSYILLTNMLDIVIYSSQGKPGNFPVITAAIFVAATFAIIGLIKRASWARIITLVVVVVEVLSTIGISIYFQSVMPDMGFNLLTSFLVFDGPLVFLAYKIYTSEAFKFYFSKQ